MLVCWVVVVVSSAQCIIQHIRIGYVVAESMHCDPFPSLFVVLVLVQLEILHHCTLLRVLVSHAFVVCLDLLIVLASFVL